MTASEPLSHSPLILDVAGLELTTDDRRRLAHPLAGGVVLFTRNWQSRDQMTALTAAIRAVRADMLICVDHEGGRVQRFRGDGMTRLPSMQQVGALWPHDPLAAADAATAVGYVLGAELRACGVDLSFAPVLDLDHARSSVIGDRAFAGSAMVVTLLAGALVHGMLRAGLQHCAKHFPGHGHATQDSHVSVPIDERPLEALLAADVLPYTRLSMTLAAVMPAHVVYPAVDARPAGFSARWLREVLRGHCGYTGAIVSDDLSMEGALHIGGRRLSHAEAVLEALAAGCDLALLCNQSLHGGASLDGTLAALDDATLEGRLRPEPPSERRRRALLAPAAGQGWHALHADPLYQQALQRLPKDITAPPSTTPASSPFR